MIKTIALALAMLVPLTMLADITQTSSVVDSSGGRSSGGSLTMISAGGQPGAVGTCSGGDKVLQQGFLNTFSLQPDLDTDGDGLADEVDTDNDGDGLDDEAEITGSAFGGLGQSNPNNADSDGDGASDGHEAAAGSDPNSDTMYLQITEIAQDRGTGEVTIEWQAQGGKTYALYCLESLNDPKPGTFLGNVTVTGGEGPWQATFTNFVHTAAPAGSRCYYVKLD